MRKLREARVFCLYLAVFYFTPQMQLLPLFLKHGKTYELPIVVPGCNHIVLHELKYRHQQTYSLIKSCNVRVNGTSHRYVQSEECPRTYYLEGERKKSLPIEVDPNEDLRFSLEITCEDFSRCFCQDQRFQLNISALCEETI